MSGSIARITLRPAPSPRPQRAGERAARRDADRRCPPCSASARAVAIAASSVIASTIVADLAVEHRGHEVGRPALDLVRLPLLAGEQLRAPAGSHAIDLHVGARELEHLAGAGQRAARAPAGDPVVEPRAGEVAQDLRAGRLAVVGRVRRVLELAREEPAALLRELLGALATMPGAALGGGREDHLRAVRAHDLAALDRERLRHHRDERIAARRAHHRERDARVARRRLDDGLAGLQRRRGARRRR